MRVSAIIPTHNRAADTVRAARSALDQTWPDMEVVVVDDGSTDDTFARLEGLGDPRLRVLRRENKGVSAARNVGLAAASGRFAAFLDSDDYWLPRKVERQAAFMLSKESEASQTEEVWIRHGVRVNPGRRHAKPTGRFFDQATRMCLVSPSCFMCEMKLFDKVGVFDETLPACEDFDLWLRVLARGPVDLLPEALTVKHGGAPDQLSRRIIGLDLYRIRSLAKFLHTHAGTLSSADRESALAALEEKALCYARGCLKRDKPDEAARVLDLWRAARDGPAPGLGRGEAG